MDLASTQHYINDVEVAQDAPLTEDLNTRFGEAINFLNNSHTSQAASIATKGNLNIQSFTVSSFALSTSFLDIASTSNGKQIYAAIYYGTWGGGSSGVIGGFGAVNASHFLNDVASLMIFGGTLQSLTVDYRSHTTSLGNPNRLFIRIGGASNSKLQTAYDTGSGSVTITQGFLLHEPG